MPLGLFSFTSYELIDLNSKKINKIIRAPEKINYKKLLYGNVIGCLTVLIDKSEIKLLKMPNIKHEDYATWLNILKNNKINAYGIRMVLAQYRRTSTSVSSNKLRAISWTWNIYRRNQNIGYFRSILYLISYFFRAIRKNYL